MIAIRQAIFNKMYYVPAFYYWLDSDTLYMNVRNQLVNNLIKSKKRFYMSNHKNIVNNMIEKTDDYYDYKSALIRIILIDYAHNHSDLKGKDLLVNIFNKWINEPKISLLDRKDIQESTLKKITKYEKEVNNIENILMLVSIQLLENFYIN